MRDEIFRLQACIAELETQLGDSKLAPGREESVRALHNAERRFHAFLEATPQLAWSNLPDGTLEFVNRSWLEYTGQNQYQAASGRWAEAIHPDDYERVWHLREHGIATGEAYCLEARLRRADGSYRWHTARIVPLQDETGQILGWYGAALDIDDLKRTEAALRASRDWLDLAQEAGQLGAFEWDLCTNQAAVSPNLLAIAGFAEGEWDGTLAGWTERIQPEDRRRVMGTLTDAFARHAPETTYEFRFVCPDGTVRWMYGRGRIYYDGQGTPLRMIGINLDLTERKRAEEELQRSNADLERFASVASHDLQEPLRMVHTYSQFLARRYQGQLDAEADGMIASVLDGIQRMQKLIKNLLAYAHAGQDAECQPTATDAALSAALDNLSSLLRETNAVIVREDLPMTLAHPDQLAQVFQNLVSNSLKYCHPERPPVVRIMAERSGAAWVISVHDNGIGFESARAAGIFQPFKRLHGNKQPGTGLGLAICQRLIERWGGEIWAESEPGVGSVFRFRLAAVEPRAEPDEIGA